MRRIYMILYYSYVYFYYLMMMTTTMVMMYVRTMTPIETHIHRLQLLRRSYRLFEYHELSNTIRMEIKK